MRSPSISRAAGASETAARRCKSKSDEIARSRGKRAEQPLARGRPLTMSSGDQPRKPRGCERSLSRPEDRLQSFRPSQYLIYGVCDFLFVSSITHLADVGREATGFLRAYTGCRPSALSAAQQRILSIVQEFVNPRLFIFLHLSLLSSIR